MNQKKACLFVVWNFETISLRNEFQTRTFLPFIAFLEPSLLSPKLKDYFYPKSGRKCFLLQNVLFGVTEAKNKN